MRKIPCESCAIRRRSIIADLRDDQLEGFHACSTVALYKPRQVIFHAGAPASALYILCHAAVKLYQSDRFGRDHILSVASAGHGLRAPAADTLLSRFAPAADATSRRSRARAKPRSKRRLV